MDIYFAYPYYSWERGTNENTNGLVRQFFPKKSSFAQITESQIKKVMRLLNGRPRKRLLTFHNSLNTFHLNNVDALRNPLRSAGSPLTLFPLALMRRSRVWESVMSAFPNSLRFLLDQTYSVGLSSGAYGGRYSTESQRFSLLRYSFTALALCTRRVSMMRISFLPRIWRFTPFRKLMNIPAFTAPFSVSKYRRGRNPFGEQVRRLITERVIHPPGTGRIGVFPFGAHVFRTIGLSEKADSSENPMRAWIFAPFFESSARIPFSNA